MGDSDFNAGVNVGSYVQSPRMWSGTECGTQCGNAGVVRTHAIQPECNVRHGTGYVRTMWGSCAAQFCLSYIEYCHPTPRQVRYDGFGALYAFPLHAKPGDILFRSASTYTSGEYHRILHMRVNSYFTRSRPITDSLQTLSNVTRLHHQMTPNFRGQSRTGSHCCALS